MRRMLPTNSLQPNCSNMSAKTLDDGGTCSQPLLMQPETVQSKPAQLAVAQNRV